MVDLMAGLRALLQQADAEVTPPAIPPAPTEPTPVATPPAVGTPPDPATPGTPPVEAPHAGGDYSGTGTGDGDGGGGTGSGGSAGRVRQGIAAHGSRDAARAIDADPADHGGDDGRRTGCGSGQVHGRQRGQALARTPHNRNSHAGFLKEVRFGRSRYQLHRRCPGIFSRAVGRCPALQAVGADAVSRGPDADAGSAWADRQRASVDPRCHHGLFHRDCGHGQQRRVSCRSRMSWRISR